MGCYRQVSLYNFIACHLLVFRCVLIIVCVCHGNVGSPAIDVYCVNVICDSTCDKGQPGIGIHSVNHLHTLYTISVFNSESHTIDSCNKVYVESEVCMPDYEMIFSSNWSRSVNAAGNVYYLTLDNRCFVKK